MLKSRYLFGVFATLLSALVLGVGILNTVNPVWWQNFKLSTTPYWSLATVENNPLLPRIDNDLSETDYRNSGIQPRINLDDLLGGGPPKDGIPSIDEPQFVPISQSEFEDDDLIIGVVHNGEAKAYPYAILNWHEIVNDTIGGTAVAVTYCPLCETNSVFIRELNGETVEFGVSGKLYQSCLVMYDRKTDALYSQPWGLGVVGEKTNHVLERIPAVRTTMGQFKSQYPDALAMTTETGHNRNYAGYPYGSYYTDENIIFPARNQDQLTEHPKEITQIIFEHDESTPLGQFSGLYQAFTQKQVREQGVIEFTWQDENAEARWNEALRTIEFSRSDGRLIPDMALFGFVLPAYFQ